MAIDCYLHKKFVLYRNYFHRNRSAVFTNNVNQNKQTNGNNYRWSKKASNIFNRAMYPYMDWLRNRLNWISYELLCCTNSRRNDGRC